MKSALGWLSVGILTVCGLGNPAWANDLDQQLDIQPQNATSGPARDVADQWMQLGNQQANDQAYQDAVQSWGQAAEIYQALGDSQAEGNAYEAMALAYVNLDQPNAAERYFRLALAVDRDNQDLAGQVFGLNNVGSILVQQGNLAAAKPLFEEALTLAQTIKDDKGIGISLSNLGLLASLQGDLATAATLYETAANYRLRGGDYLGEARSSNSLGDVYVALGREGNAIGAYRVALRAGVEAGDEEVQLRALDGLLTIYLGRDDLDNVQVYLDQRADLTLSTTPADLNTAITWRWMGDYYQQVGDTDAAEAAYSQGLNVARSLDAKSLEAELFNRLRALE